MRKDTAHPTQGSDFVDDSVPGQLDPITPDRRDTFGLGGATGYNPTPKGTAIGACCIDDTCLLLSRNACVSQGGIYQGDDTECNPDPCAVPAIPVSWGGLKFANR